jgi:hypothetical protein
MAMPVDLLPHGDEPRYAAPLEHRFGAPELAPP